MSWFAPARRRGYEILDDDKVDAGTRLASIGDVTRSNRLFGGRRAATLAVSDLLSNSAQLTLLDVGTGLGDIPHALSTLARENGATLRTIGLDEATDLLQSARGRLADVVAGTAASLPFRDKSIDVVVCSQLLHHFADEHLAPIIRELNRVATRRVVISDLRRSRVAALGFWLASFPLGFHPVTRHDGVVSVYRGFTGAELSRVIQEATGIRPIVRHRLGFRLTASWTPA